MHTTIFTVRERVAWVQARFLQGSIPSGGRAPICNNP